MMHTAGSISKDRLISDLFSLLLETNVLKRNLLVRNLLERNILERNLLERNLLKRNLVIINILKSLLEVDLLGLGEPGAGGLSPSVIEIKVLVVQMLVDVFTVSGLVVLSGDVALLLEVFGADLSDMHINEVGVVTVDLHHLVGVLAVDVDVVVGADVLVGQDHLRLAELVSRGIHVSNLQVASLLLLIDLEEEVLIDDDLDIGTRSEPHSINLIFKVKAPDLKLCFSAF